MKQKPINLLLDVDGVLTTGSFIYTKKGKFGKLFGPDDNDALKILSKFINISFLTSDFRGFNISKKRILNDMNYKINLVKNEKRFSWINKNYDLKKTIYMADGIFDWIIMKECAYSISCNNSNELTKKYSDFTTKSNSGDRAVSEACLHLIKKFYYKGKIENLILSYHNDIKKKT